MLLAVSLDGADSPEGGCTTHLASLLLLEAARRGYRLADYPWLVRLNPSVPFKTRGNGAVVIWLSVETRSDAVSFARYAERMLEDYAGATSSGKKAGLVAILFETGRLPVGDPSLTRLYNIALRSLTTPRVALEHLEEARGEKLVVAGGGGLVGAIAALGARLDIDHTYEILFYMPPSLWGRRPELEPSIVVQIDFETRPYNIATFDYITLRPLIQPHGPDPVLAGIRADEPHPLLRAARLIKNSFYTHAVVYKSNQHTGVHIREASLSSTRPYDCVRICGSLVELADIPGGHRIGVVCDETGCIEAAFYRELGRSFHLRLSSLIGTEICIEGCIRPHRGRLTLNTEKVIVPNNCGIMADRIAPPCPRCGTRMKRVSRNVYRCETCGLRVYGVQLPIIREYVSTCVLEPVPSAWHHLYLPLARAMRITLPRGLGARPSGWRDVLLIASGGAGTDGLTSPSNTP